MTESVTFLQLVNSENQFADRMRIYKIMRKFMSQTIKVYLSVFILAVTVLVCVSLVGADTGVSNARAYHDSCIKQIEESNMSQTVIDSCKSNAATLGYTVTTNNVTDDRNKVVAVEVVTDYTYKIPILGISKTHSLRNIAR